MTLVERVIERQWQLAGDFADLCRENMECPKRSRTDRAYWFARWIRNARKALEAEDRKA